MDYHPFKALVNWYFARQVGGTQRPVFFEIASVNPALCAVTANYSVIREELERLLARGMPIPRYHDIDPGQAEIAAVVDPDRRWNVFMLYLLGHKLQSNRALCPKTSEALDQIPDLIQAFFSILDPGKSVPLHRGPYLGYLRYHLALHVPAENPPKLVVNGEDYVWKFGEAVIFDDTWPHEVVNTSDDIRSVLIVDVLRPMPLVPSLVNKLLAQCLARLTYGRAVARRIREYAETGPTMPPTTGQCSRSVRRPRSADSLVASTMIADSVSYVKFFLDPIGCITKIHREIGPLAEVSCFGKPFVFALGPEFNRQILGDPATFHVIPITLLGPEQSAQRRIGTGLVTINDDLHKRHRRLVLPQFRGKAIEMHCDAIVSTTAQMLDGWRCGEGRDVLPDMTRLTVRIAGSTLFSLDDPYLARTTAELINRWFHANASPLARLLRRDVWGTPYHRLLGLAQRIERQIVKLIEHRRASAAEGHDVLSILLRAHDEDGEMLTDEEVIGETTVLFAAAHETTSKVLTWTLFLLAQHPSIAVDLVDELQGVLRGHPLTVEHLGRLPLLDRVVKESMRILPPVPFNFRKTTRPVQLGGKDVPEGRTVLFSHYVTHHMPELYAEPETFQPDRWLTINPSQYEYLPFSAGPRMCIGAGFATMAIKVALAMILYRHRLTVVPNARIDRSVDITLSPRYGMPMTIGAQDREFARVPVLGNIHEMVDLR